jgi:galactokinase
MSSPCWCDNRERERQSLAGRTLPGDFVQRDTLEERLQQLETRMKLLDIKDSEEIRALEIIKQDAESHGLDLKRGKIRRSSSRFCLGVEHGDYNGTDLFGVGTDRFIWLAYKPNNSGKVRIYSHNFPEEGVIEFNLGQVPPPRSPEIADTWARFPYGVDDVLRKHDLAPTVGFDAVIVGNIPGRHVSICFNDIESYVDNA